MVWCFPGGRGQHGPGVDRLADVGWVPGAPATAAAVVRKQNKQGAFETSPMENVVTGVTQVVEAQQKADQEVERVKNLLSEAVSSVPMLGPMAIYRNR